MGYESADLLVLGYPFSQDSWRHELQGRGVRTVPYISFYKAPEMTRVLDTADWTSGSPSLCECLINPFWKAVATDGKPDFVALDEQGRVRRPFENKGYAQGWSQTTPLSPSYRAACLAGVRAILDAGFDGVFLDNVAINGRPPHAGMGDSKAIAAAMRSLVLEAAALVHGHHPGALFVLNGGDDDKEVRRVADAYVWESFLYSWAWDFSWFDLPAWTNFWRALEPLRNKPWSGTGAQPIALAYLGFSGKPLREECFSFLALAWILGMAAADAGTALDHTFMTEFASKNLFQGAIEGALRSQSLETATAWARDFYQLDVGLPVSDIQICEETLVREFENGVCAFNPTATGRKITVSSRDKSVIEHACGVGVEVRDGKLTLWVSPYSGRVATWARYPLGDKAKSS